MIVDCRVPEIGPVHIDDVIGRVCAAPLGRPYAPSIVDVCADFAATLMRSPLSRVHPELMTLAFFMRRSALTRMAEDFTSSTRTDVVRVPQGLVFHVPPANVDTIFMYSWVLSVLAGNATIVRLSSRPSDLVEQLCSLLATTMERSSDAALRSRVAMIRYGHDAGITEAISRRCALRVVWGGDRAVAAIRRSPLPPWGRDLTFPDRWSMLALDVAAVHAMNDGELRDLAIRVYNDIFWFGQRACSSPRLCAWIGDSQRAKGVAQRLWAETVTVARARGYAPSPSVRVARESFVYRAVLDSPVIARRDYGSELTILTLQSLHGIEREDAAEGVLYEAVVDRLRDIKSMLRRKDQTLAYYGITIEELRDLVAEMAGQGIDRVVPVGNALSMSRFWDGFDLSAEMVRHICVQQQ